MSSSARILPQHDIATTGSNLLSLLAVCVMIFWFFRLCSCFYRLYRLNLAIASEQVVRLQTAEMEPDERAMLFGEMQMLWRSNLQQQLLRAHHAPPAVDVSELNVPFFIDKSSVEVQEDGEYSRVGVNFRFRMTQRMAIQMYWQVKKSAIRDLLSKVNKEHLGVGGNASATGHKRKRFFGKRYMPVNNRESSTQDADSAAGRSFEMSDRASIEVGTSARSQAPIFGDDQCAARSGVVMLTDDGCETWVVFDNPDQCQVPASVYRRFLPPSPRPSAELRRPAALDDERGGSDEEETAGAGGAGSQVEQDVVVEDIEDGDLTAPEQSAAVGAGEGGEDVFTVVIVAKALHDEEGGAVAAGAGAEEAPERVKLVMAVGQLERRQGGEAPRRVQVTQQVVVSSRAAYVSKEIYGEQQEEDAQEECVICLSEPKDTTLLPCRHLCVCADCFSRLQQCPVCRSPFTAYLRVPVKEAEDQGEEAQQSSPRADGAVQGQS